MKTHILQLIPVVLIISVIVISLPAVTLTDNFNDGLDGNWEVFNFSANNAPWTIQSEQGQLRIAKSSDTDSSLNVYGLVQSLFSLDGDLSVSVDFNLFNFPLANKGGWNEAVLRLVGSNNQDMFSVLRFSNVNQQYIESFSCLSPYVFGEMTDTTFQGKFGIIRSGQTVSSWLDRGYGRMTIGSLDSPELLGSVKIQIYAAQIPQIGIRPSTSLDVRFDNFTATADSIIMPEPMTFLVLGMGGLLIRKR